MATASIPQEQWAQVVEKKGGRKSQIHTSQFPLVQYCISVVTN